MEKVKKRIHQNSRDSWKELQNTLSKRHQEIINSLIFLSKHFSSMFLLVTDRNIATHLNKEDMNYVRPRITELINKGIFIEQGKVKDYKTNRTVRTFRLNLNMVSI